MIFYPQILVIFGPFDVAKTNSIIRGFQAGIQNLGEISNFIFASNFLKQDN